MVLNSVDQHHFCLNILTFWHLSACCSTDSFSCLILLLLNDYCMQFSFSFSTRSPRGVKISCFFCVSFLSVSCRVLWAELEWKCNGSPPSTAFICIKAWLIWPPCRLSGLWFFVVPQLGAAAQLWSSRLKHRYWMLDVITLAGEDGRFSGFLQSRWCKDRHLYDRRERERERHWDTTAGVKTLLTDRQKKQREIFVLNHFICWWCSHCTRVWFDSPNFNFTGEGIRQWCQYLIYLHQLLYKEHDVMRTESNCH